MKIIGIDYGRRRIGIAASDDGGTIAHGLCAIDRKVTADPVSEICRIISDEKAEAIVFGLPLGPDDEETTMSHEVRAFAAALSARTNIPIHFIDESFTSKKAAELMMHRKKKARRDKSLTDRIAACLILQDFLDQQGVALHVSVGNGLGHAPF